MTSMLPMITMKLLRVDDNLIRYLFEVFEKRPTSLLSRDAIHAQRAMLERRLLRL